MDIASIMTLIALGITCIAGVIGGMFGGIVGASIVLTLCIAGFSILPATPILPLWAGILMIIAEAVYLAYTMGNAFGLGKTGGQ